MPTALAMDRTRVCTYTFENSSKCRIPLTSHPNLCTFHARKEAENRATDEAVRDIAFHLSNRYVSHCDLSAAIAQTITAVAYNHIPVRTAATIAYLTQNLVQSLAGAEKEFKDTFGIYAWRQTIAKNFNNPRPNDSAVQPAPAERAVSNSHPAPTDDRANDPASTAVNDAAIDPQIPSAQPPGEPEQAPTENNTEDEAQHNAANNSESDGASNSEGHAESYSAGGTETSSEAAAESNSQTVAVSDTQNEVVSDAQNATEYEPEPPPSTTAAPITPHREDSRQFHPQPEEVEAALARLRVAMETQ